MVLKHYHSRLTRRLFLLFWALVLGLCCYYYVVLVRFVDVRVTGITAVYSIYLSFLVLYCIPRIIPAFVITYLFIPVMYVGLNTKLNNSTHRLVLCLWCSLCFVRHKPSYVRTKRCMPKPKAREESDTLIVQFNFEILESLMLSCNVFSLRLCCSSKKTFTNYVFSSKQKLLLFFYPF